MLRALLVAVLSLPAVASAAAPKTKIVVLEVKASEAQTKRLATQMQEQLLTELSREKRFDVLGKSDIEALLGLERQKQLLGCSDGSSCLAELGGALGAKYVVLGNVGRAGKRFRVDVKAIEPSANKALYRGGKTLDREDELFAAVADLAKELSAAVPPEPEPAAPPLVELKPTPTPAPAPVAVTPVVVAEPARPSQVPLVSLLGSAVVTIAGGGILIGGFTTESSLRGKLQTLTFDEARAQVSGVERTYTIGWVVLGAGAVLLAASLVWFLVTR